MHSQDGNRWTFTVFSIIATSLQRLKPENSEKKNVGFLCFVGIFLNG